MPRQREKFRARPTSKEEEEGSKSGPTEAAAEPLGRSRDGILPEKERGILLQETLG